MIGREVIDRYRKAEGPVNRGQLARKPQTYTAQSTSTMTPMRRIRYRVACSLDGYIADRNGGFEWIVSDPEIDFAALFEQFDTFIMGRRTYEMIPPGDASLKGKSVIVVSRTLRQEDHVGVRIIPDNFERELRELRSQSGKDIWLFGGAEFFRSAWNAECVDSVETAIMPILLGGGLQLLPAPAVTRQLELRSHRVYKSGIVLLEYDVKRKEAD
jgi:dihydrofolate reductase